ncbi:MAG: hypothetical protein MI757_11230, partial [Pirellulales bacterium]|nr:hypothetical protein [Pirellulales bacterium]
NSYFGHNNKLPREKYKRLFSTLMAYSLKTSTLRETRALDIGPDRIRLLVYADMPEELYPTDAGLGQSTGRVMYQHVILKPE